MKDFKLITRENIPCWYELSWNEKEPAIILRIHRDFVKAAQTLSVETPIVQYFMKEFKFSNFKGNLNDDFGFDNNLFEGTFDYQGEKGEFTEFLIKIPIIKAKTQEVCDSCHGSGKDKIIEEDERKCFSCGGTGFEYVYKWQLVHAISASFSTFFRLASFHEKETSAPFPQLMTIETITGTEMWHSGSLGGEFSIPLTKWLASLYQGRDTTIPEVVKATKTAYDHMFHDDCSSYGFKAYVGSKDGGVIIDCPGDATGIHPDEWRIEKGQGYKFCCHNVDNAAQQLTLLAGLAALHSKARKEIKNY